MHDTKVVVQNVRVLNGGIFFRFTGYTSMKIGKTAAFLIGGGIIFLEVANDQGWVNIDCMFCRRLR